MNQKVKKGDLVWVSDKSIESATEEQMERIYVINFKGLHYCAIDENTGLLTRWNYIVPIPKSSYIPWTYETCPLPPFCVKHKDKDGYNTITDVAKSNVWSSNIACSYQDLLDNYDLVISRDDLRPCGDMV